MPSLILVFFAMEKSTSWNPGEVRMLRPAVPKPRLPNAFGLHAAPTNPRPTSFWIDPDREILLKFEPPLLAWTYHLNSASPLAQTLVTGWYRCLSRVTRGRDLDSVVRTIVRPHEVYAVRVKSDERVPVCQGDETRHWTMSIETWRGDRTLRLDDRVGDYLP